MNALKEKILQEGSVIGTEIIKVDQFLNHRIDVKFLEEIGEEFHKRFAEERITKILTVEASGIAIAVIAAKYFDYVPVVFAKKAVPSTMTGGSYTAEARSFTKGTVSMFRVSREALSPEDRVLILDDFLASGEAGFALAEIVKAAGAAVCGIGSVIEKEYQGGSRRLREAGYRGESLAVIKGIENGTIVW